MAKTAELTIKNAFADDSTRSIKFPLNPDNVDSYTLKANVKAFDASNIAGIYLSDGGATCTGISAASLVEVEENEINLNVSE